MGATSIAQYFIGELLHPPRASFIGGFRGITRSAIAPGSWRKIMAYTYDITIRCKTPEEREIVLETIDEGVADSQSKNLIELEIVRYRGENPNTYFSESDGGVKTRYSEAVIT